MIAGHPWVQVGGVAPDKPLDSAVLSRLKQFSAMNKLKKIAIRVSIHQLFKIRSIACYYSLTLGNLLHIIYYLCCDTVPSLPSSL